MKTELNDGRFFGRKNNPDIVDLNIKHNIQFKLPRDNITRFISSPLKRCIQSLENLGIDQFETSDLLLEMDYGDADGLFINEFENKYPEIYKKWKDGKDEAFPNGESYKIVSDRLFEFLKSVERIIA